MLPLCSHLKYVSEKPTYLLSITILLLRNHNFFENNRLIECTSNIVVCSSQICYDLLFLDEYQIHGRWKVCPACFFPCSIIHDLFCCCCSSKTRTLWSILDLKKVQLLNNGYKFNFTLKNELILLDKNIHIRGTTYDPRHLKNCCSFFKFLRDLRPLWKSMQRRWKSG